jgi:hypothetical protein
MVAGAREEAADGERRVVVAGFWIGLVARK